MRKPPPPKVVQVESSEDEVLNISSSSSDSSSEGDSDESGSSSGAENDRDALTTVFNKCKRYATRLAVKISLFAADARMLEPRADAGAVIRPQPTRCDPPSIVFIHNHLFINARLQHERQWAHAAAVSVGRIQLVSASSRPPAATFPHLSAGCALLMKKI
jgi:hypothetical protein